MFKTIYDENSYLFVFDSLNFKPSIFFRWQNDSIKMHQQIYKSCVIRHQLSMSNVHQIRIAGFSIVNSHLFDDMTDMKSKSVFKIMFSKWWRLVLKNNHHDIIEIFLKVALNTLTLKHQTGIHAHTCFDGRCNPFSTFWQEKLFSVLRISIFFLNLRTSLHHLENIILKTDFDFMSVISSKRWLLTIEKPAIRIWWTLDIDNWWPITHDL
jgi:hypothetical protein